MVTKRVSLTIARITFSIEMIETQDRTHPLVRYLVDDQRVDAADFDRCMRMVEMGALVTRGEGKSGDASDAEDDTNPIT